MATSVDFLATTAELLAVPSHVVSVPFACSHAFATFLGTPSTTHRTRVVRSVGTSLRSTTIRHAVLAVVPCDVGACGKRPFAIVTTSVDFLATLTLPFGGPSNVGAISFLVVALVAFAVLGALGIQLVAVFVSLTERPLALDTLGKGLQTTQTLPSRRKTDVLTTTLFQVTLAPFAIAFSVSAIVPTGTLLHIAMMMLLALRTLACRNLFM